MSALTIVWSPPPPWRLVGGSPRRMFVISSASWVCRWCRPTSRTRSGSDPATRGAGCTRVMLVPSRPRQSEVNAITAQRHSLVAQPLELPQAHRCSAIHTNDSMPWDVRVISCENAADSARRVRIDIAICTYEPVRNRPYSRDDRRGVGPGTRVFRPSVRWGRGVLRDSDAAPPTDAQRHRSAPDSRRAMRQRWRAE
jgi:hypothetical protein